MTTKYSYPSVEPIQEDSEDDLIEESRGKVDPSRAHTYYRQSRSGDVMMAPTRGNSGREREKRRTHRSSCGRRHAKTHGRETEVKQASGRIENDRPRIRHRRTSSNRSTSSTSSSEDEREPVQDHREVLAQARAKLTSPSMLSTLTSLTTSTNTSGGSSGSNSTVTQASITKRSVGKRPEIPEEPMSPAVPDAPNVFAYLDNGSTTTLGIDDGQDDHEVNLNGEHEEEDEEEDDDDHDGVEHEEGDEEEEEEEEDGHDEVEQDSQWPSHDFTTTSLPHLSPDQGSASSSGSSSLHGSDHFDEPIADNDTDRSTSPERSVKDQTFEQKAPSDAASTKIASQIAAAQQRQNLYTSGAVQSFGTPNMARGNAVYPYVPGGSALNQRYTQHVKQRSLPRAEKLPVTGYELLASRLSHANADSDEGGKIKPMYRKFEGLNHRLLLHLQDEISELEERLHRLDHADTQSRTAGLTGAVVPASRRAAQAAGGELQWHKTDVLGRIGFKLAQYNQALAAFNTTQGLNPPDPDDVSTYREYLSTEHPIVEAETHFLDPADDLVSVCSERVPRCLTSLSPETQTSYASSVAYENGLTLQPSQSGFSSLAIAIAVSVLIPILTFSVIPGFIGRMTVVGLVAGGVVGALMQSGVIGRSVLGREALVCSGIYGGAMIILAGVTA